ncbi:MAG: hypothetical protein WKF61_00365 [Luteimonas sp.]
MKFNKTVMISAMAVAALCMFGSADVLAQASQPSGNGLDQIAVRGAQTGNNLINAARVFAIVIGVIMLISGFLALWKDAKAQGNGPVSKGAAFMIILVGGALTFVTSLIDSTGQTIWGSEGGSREKIEIQQ